MTVIWFAIWRVANNIGDREPLLVDPVNWWAATLILAAALDPLRYPARTADLMQSSYRSRDRPRWV